MTDIHADHVTVNAMLGIESAPVGRRMLSFTLDLLVLLVLTAPLALGLVWLIDDRPLKQWLIPVAVGGGLVVLYLVVQMVVEGLVGRTLGKRATGLRAVNEETLLPPGAGNVMLRNAVVWIPGMVVPVLGAVPFLASILGDGTGRARGWHDRASGVWLVDVRNGLDPRDREALRAARRELTRPTVPRLADLPSLASGRRMDPALTELERSRAGVISLLAGEPVPWEAEVVAPPAAPPAPAAVAAPAAHAAHAAVPGSTAGWVLVLDDGSRQALTDHSLLGRAPTAPDGAEDYALIPLTDPAMKMSRTHLAVTIESGRVWIADLETANGTEVLLPSGEQVELAPREAYVVEPGSRIVIGERTFIFEETDR